METPGAYPELKAETEALVFASEQPVSAAELARILSQYHETTLSEEEMEVFLQELVQHYRKAELGFELVKAGGGYLFLTKKALQPLLTLALAERSRKRLSQAALETLSIVAYRQPVTKSELEHIRGVNCDYSIQRLLERRLIVISGKSDGPGRPLLYSTSELFMEYFGINSMEELPQLKELDNQDNSIGNSDNEE